MEFDEKELRREISYAIKNIHGIRHVVGRGGVCTARPGAWGLKEPPAGRTRERVLVFGPLNPTFPAPLREVAGQPGLPTAAVHWPPWLSLGEGPGGTGYRCPGKHSTGMDGCSSPQGAPAPPSAAQGAERRAELLGRVWGTAPRYRSKSHYEGSFQLVRPCPTDSY